MVQNRNKVIELFIGNLANSVMHSIIESAINNEELSERYKKEIATSLDAAKKYREKINPVESSLSSKDIEYIKNKITNKVKAELQIRISKKYENIDLSSIEKFVDKSLKETKVT